MAGGLIIREASREDVDAVADLVARLKTLNEELDPSFRTSQRLREEARRYVEESLSDPKARLIVAAVGDEVVGLLRLVFIDRVFYEPRIKALITDLYVKPGYRRRGIGRLLVEYAVDVARREGAGIISAVFPEGNVIARRFYEELGFRVLQVEVFKPVK